MRCSVYHSTALYIRISLISSVSSSRLHFLLASLRSVRISLCNTYTVECEGFVSNVVVCVMLCYITLDHYLQYVTPVTHAGLGIRSVIGMSSVSIAFVVSTGTLDHGLSVVS